MRRLILFSILISANAWGAKKPLDLRPSSIVAVPEATTKPSVKKEKEGSDLSNRLTDSFDTLSIGKHNMRIKPEGAYYTREQTYVEEEEAPAPKDPEFTKSLNPQGEPR
ncbi:MAG: hypothetical protein ABL958_13495 [Bdellovibrionia bacterium]